MLGNINIELQSAIETPSTHTSKNTNYQNLTPSFGKTSISKSDLITLFTGRYSN